jgi:inosine/xanthosine triphosphatase
MRVVVGSQNPVKIQAARDGFGVVFPDAPLTVTGVSVPSGVSAQPMGDDETRRGAHNRAANTFAVEPSADYTVGLEGGCSFEPDGKLQVFAWIAVYRADGVRGESRTGTFYLPREVARLLAQGFELGDADDIVFGRENSKQGTGSVGILTRDRITRATYYSPAVVLALIPFLNADLSF